MITILLGFLTSFVRAAVAQSLWGWFAVDTGLTRTTLSYWQMYGVLLLVNLFTFKVPSKREIEDEKSVGWPGRLGISIGLFIAYMVALAVGALVHSFI